MKLRIENLFVFMDGNKKIRVHLDHVNPYGKYGAELVFKGITNKKTYRCSRAGMKYAERVDAGICFFMDDKDIKSLKNGDDVYIFYSNKIQAFQFARWHHDKAVICQEVEKNGEKMSFRLKVKPHLLLARPHKFTGNPDYMSEVYNCENCKAIKTKRAHAV